ncbi:MAG: methionyl-tRNA formyltransferase [Betaproteobacteria bacterium]
MRLIFAGTPAFAELALRALLDAGHDIGAVLTQPDRPAGRGMKPRHSEVKLLALERGLAVLQFTTLKSPDALAALRAIDAAAMIVAAYGLILPQAVLDLFPLGCINIHASLLPRWRGAAPIQRAILAGDSTTGISIMQMDAGLDTGPVYASHRLAVEADDTGASLHDKLAALGGRAIVATLSALAAGTVNAAAQPAEGASYAHKIDKNEAHIDWRLSAAQIERQVRAFNPFPVASTTLQAAPLRIWRATMVDAGNCKPGIAVDTAGTGIIVGCGSGALRIHELQRAGGKRLGVDDFMRGSPVIPGENFGA